LITGVLVLAAIIGGIFIAGTPATARLMVFDQQKVSDLTGIQWEIVKHWQAKGKLPATLADLKDPISGYTAPQDPQTNQPYEYIIKDSRILSFQLCAEFNKTNQSRTKVSYPVGTEISQNWEHGIGRTCFDRVIDKEIYSVKKP
jgi:hypothetical protein